MQPNKQDKVTANWMKEAQKGYIRIGVLILLNRKPAHGYELMKEIKDRTKGFWSPTPGGVYPILANLEKAHYIKGEWSTKTGRKIKIYKITQSGKLILKNALEKQSEITNNMYSLFKEFAVDVLKIEPEAFTMPTHSPFAAFLEEKEERTFQQLEDAKKHLLQSIKMQQEQLKDINKKLAEARKNQPEKT
ncbi:MAG: PadR family transcriptional regulator [Candidatus Bathyarchaeota archaeon]|nr:PadR family transcriptional regulator [Candidatus Bathyarchaeota archaeon]